MQSTLLLVAARCERSVVLQSDSEPGRFRDWRFRVRVFVPPGRVEQNRRLLEATTPELEVGIGGGS